MGESFFPYPFEMSRRPDCLLETSVSLNISSQPVSVLQILKSGGEHREEF